MSTIITGTLILSNPPLNDDTLTQILAVDPDGQVKYVDSAALGGGGGGTVTSFSSGALSPLFTTNVATATSTPALSFALVNQNANIIYAGPTNGAAAAPSFRALVTADIGDDIITLPKIENIAALSVVANATNGSASPTAVAAATDHHVLRRLGTSIGFGQIDATVAITGILPVANGGSGTSTAFTLGSVIFAGASGVYSQDNANLFWHDTNNQLGIGTNSLNATDTRFQVRGTGNSSSTNARFESQDGTEIISFFDNKQIRGTSGLMLLGGTVFTSSTRLDVRGITSGTVLRVADTSNNVLFQVANNATVTLNLGSDATGDVYRRNSSGNLQRLALGTALQVLRVNAGATDIEYASPLTNTAAADELAKSNGTNLVASGLFTDTPGNLTLGGVATAGSARSFIVQGSATDIGMQYFAKGAGQHVFLGDISLTMDDFTDEGYFRIGSSDTRSLGRYYANNASMSGGGTSDVGIFSFTDVPNNSTVMFKINIVGVNSTGAQGFWAEILTGWRKSNSGTITKIGTDTVRSDEDLAGTVTFSTIASGSTIQTRIVDVGSTGSFSYGVFVDTAVYNYSS